MSKQTLSNRIVACAAVLMLCLSPVAMADDGLSPFSVVELIQETIADLGDWLDNLWNDGDDGGDDGGSTPDATVNVDPIG